jgi:hypothetical protein
LNVAAVAAVEIEVRSIVVAVVVAESVAKATAVMAPNFKSLLLRAVVVAGVEEIKEIEGEEETAAGEVIEVAGETEADLVEVVVEAPSKKRSSRRQLLLLPTYAIAHED